MHEEPLGQDAVHITWTHKEHKGPNKSGRRSGQQVRNKQTNKNNGSTLENRVG